MEPGASRYALVIGAVAHAQYRALSSEELEGLVDAGGTLAASQWACGATGHWTRRFFAGHCDPRAEHLNECATSLRQSNESIAADAAPIPVRGALVVGALLPFALRGTCWRPFRRAGERHACSATVSPLPLAFWMRLSIRDLSRHRSSYVIFPAALTGHGLMVVALLLTRLSYDRLGLALGFGFHVCGIISSISTPSGRSAEDRDRPRSATLRN